MIINFILFLLYTGWLINACVIQAKYGLDKMFWVWVSL